MWEKQQYGALINKILHQGEKRKTRAGDAYSLFGEVLTIDASREFPLLRGRRMFYGPVLGELAAMFRGPKHVDDFKAFGCNYWDSWGYGKNTGDIVDEPGRDKPLNSLTLDYGNAWIDFNGVNQLEVLVKTLRENPQDRRMVVSGWRPDRLKDLSLPCCHMLYQWYVRESKQLDMIWYQRSADVMVGVPSDIVLAAAWNAVLAKQTGHTPGKITMIFGDTHIYANHMNPTLDYVRQLNSLDPKALSELSYTVAEDATMEGFVPDMIQVRDYSPKPAVKFTLNV